VLLSSLPPRLPVPILIAQHISEGFTEGLVRWFSTVSRLPVHVAEEGQGAEPGHVYLAPDGRDLELDMRLLLRTPKHASVHTPSGNRLLQTVGRALGPRSLGVVLTGMGDDGALGLLAIRKAGGITFAQDEATSVVFGMPDAAQSLGAPQRMLPLESIGPSIVELCMENANE
jgi:two-component system chemotaxis response regulator CheB